jgi:predicted PurR-regulated permease PerM
MRGVPLVGEQAARGWEGVAALGPDELRARIEPYRRSIAAWILQQAGGLALFFLHLLLTVIIAAAFYANGESVVLGVRAFARRLAGPRGEEMAFLAAQAVRAVALGVVVTAALEALLAGLGLVLAGVPFAAFLTALVFVFAVAQAPLLVLLPVVAWLYWQGDSPLVASAFLVWSILIAMVDNVLRPILIKRTARLPLPLIFAGVVGGLIAFGAVGLFVGPVVLAVAYTLLAGWVAGES